MIKMTCRINPPIVVKVVNLDISRIYSCNHMVEMDKISSSVGRMQSSNSMRLGIIFPPQIVGSC
jgi:hypothetical protein